MKLDNWAIVYDPRQDVRYQPPEMMAQSLIGKVSGDPRREDGTEIVTSHIKGKRGNKVVTSSGSEYELGTVKENYERLYPNAKEKFWNSLPELEEAV